MLIFDYFVSQKTPMSQRQPMNTIQFIRGKLALDQTTNLTLVHLSTILQMKNRSERMIIVYLNSYVHMTYSSRHTAGGGSGGNRPGQQLVNRPQQHRNQIHDNSRLEGPGGMPAAAAGDSRGGGGSIFL